MNEIIQGDCLEVLKTLPDESVDLVCTDPPYGIGFMGKEWDTFKPEVLRKGVKTSGRKESYVENDPNIRSEGSAAMESARYDHSPSGTRKFREWFTEISVELLRVMKPSAFAFVCIGARQDSVSAAITAMTEAGFKTDFTSIFWTYASGFPKAMNIGKKDGPKGAYAGFQPKPAVEVIIVAMKPLSEKTYVDQALKNGKGITWLDDAKMPPGRFPANLLVSDDVLNDGRVTKSNYIENLSECDESANTWGGTFQRNRGARGHNDPGSFSRFFDLDAWWAKTFPFLIVPKAAKSEKDKGLHGLPDKEGGIKNDSGRGYSAGNPMKPVIVKNSHPTVKPLKLMSYLITLGSRPGDMVLDPFLGSGTTALAAKSLGRNYIGIEREKEYCEIAEARISAFSQQNTLI